MTYAASKRWARDDSEPVADAWPTVKKTYDAVIAEVGTLSNFSEWSCVLLLPLESKSGVTAGNPHRY